MAVWPLGRHLWAGHHFRAARQSMEQRDFQAADAHLRKCLALRGEDGATRLLLARCARRAGRYDEAERQLARCRKVEGAVLESALLRVQRGDRGDAENYLKRTIPPDHPDVTLVLEALAVGYAKTDRLMDVMECTDLWLRVRPEDPQALYWRGHACERMRQTDQARSLYQRAVDADPNYDEARIRLGELLLGRYSEPAAALEQFESARRRRSDDPAVLLGLAHCYRLLDRLDEAEQAIESVLAQKPKLAEALTERGKLALARERPSEAEDWLRRAVALAGDDREALYALLQCLNRQGKQEEAETHDARLKKLTTDLARLDVLIAEIGREPNNPEPRCEAGGICLRYGKDQEVLRWLSSALRADPNHAATQAALAEYYQQHGRSDREAPK